METIVSNENGSYVKKLDTYKYDSKGNLISENHPEDPADEADTEYQTTYTYDTTYNLMTSKIYKKDKNTTVSVRYTLNDDKKSVASEITCENGIPLKASEYEYDRVGNLVKNSVKMNSDQWAVTTYSYGQEYGYAYPSSKTSVGVINADGASEDITEKYTYDLSTGNLLSKTDGNGNTTTYTYDNLNRVLKEALPDGLCRTYSYDDTYNVLTTVNANNDSIIYHYDPFGLLASVSEKSSGAVLTARTYDSRDNLISSTDGNGNKTEYAYDSTNRITSVIVHDNKNNLVSKTLASYLENFLDSDGNRYFKVTVTKKGGMNDLFTNYYFDGKDMLVKMGRVSDKKEEFYYYQYNYLQNKISETGYDGAATAYTYNALSELLKTTDAEGGTTSYAYDGLGNQISATNALGITSCASYDALGRKVSVKTPQEHGEFAITRYYYDATGNLVKTIDPDGFITKYSFTNRGFLNSVEQVMSSSRSNIVRMEYDGEGKQTALYTGLSSWEDTNFSKYTYGYDVYGNVTSETDATGLETTYTYDMNGNKISTTGRNNVTTYDTFDGLNRLICDCNSKDGVDKAVKNEYDLSGSLLKTSDPSGTTEYTYDSLGRVSRIRYSYGFEKEYTYDKADRMTSLTLKQGSVIEMSLAYEYDKVGRLTAVVNDGVRSTYTYNLAGQLISETNGQTGVISSYQYTPSGAIKSLQTYCSGEIVNSFEYEYDLRGNQTKKIENGEETRYYYDALSRLRLAVIPGNVMQEYDYDDYSNITKLAELNGNKIEESNYYYDRNNRLLLKESGIGDGTVQSRFEYDVEGNLVYKEEATAQNGTTTTQDTSYLFNGRNQLQAVIDPQGEIYEYTYDASGLRTSKVSQDDTINYLNENGNILTETDADGRITAKNIWGKKLLERQTEEETYGYLFNGHGDIVALTDENGETLKDYAYDPYGNEKDTDAPGTAQELMSAEGDGIYNPFRYCGEYYDLETNTYYLRARYYDPTTGRFLSEDPIRNGLNYYTYCSGNPIAFIDPWGLADIALRSTIEGLGGTVEWNNNNKTATIYLDGQSVAVYAGDKNGSYIDENGRMHTDDAWLFTALAYTFDLGKGWTGRIEQHGTGNGYQKHVVLTDRYGTEYAQNIDGSPHDKGGSPPNSIKKKLKSQEGWDWNQKDKDWLNKIEISADPAGYYFIAYPNGRTVTVYKPSNYYSMPYYPSNQSLRDYYYGSTYIDLSGGSTTTNPSIPFLPMPNPVPIPMPAPAPIPLPVFP